MQFLLTGRVGTRANCTRRSVVLAGERPRTRVGKSGGRRTYPRIALHWPEYKHVAPQRFNPLDLADTNWLEA
eukprot:3908094-Rhodomonas_salina.1